MEEKYISTWLAFVQIKLESGFDFCELVESDIDIVDEYVGAWANVIVKSADINQALEIVHLELKEKHFMVSFIDKIENIQSLIETKALKPSVIQEVDWLLQKDFVFLISDKIFPFTE